MDKHTATEQAYKNGYAKGYADGKEEKQIPQKLRIDKHDWKCCPRCYKTFSLMNMLNERNRYCGNCGQALDWSGG